MKAQASRLKPIRKHILVRDMNFGEQKTASGIVLRSDDGKSEGVKPRWARVFAVGPEQTDVKVNEWVLLEHGRWTRGVEVEEDDGTKFTIWRADPSGILATADEKPNDIEIGQFATPTHGSVHSPADFIRPTL
jgi:co-chaperonin GroES (HSP10)